MNKIITFKQEPKKHNVGVIISARMTSKRFPGKSMAILHGKPVIQWTMERCKQIRARKQDKIQVILAVPDTDESEPMIALAANIRVDNFCGDELDVLSRYFHAAIYFKFDIIMRITGDCPFVDPRVASECLQLLIWRKLDYVSNSFPVRSYPRGLDCEVFTFDALEAAYKLSNKPGDAEHVTPWMQRTPGLNRFNVRQKEDMSHKNWCVDYPHDIQRLEKEISKFQLRLVK